ncbi:MAG: thioredoxin domain-containing protein [Mariniblastus sp.]
MRSRKRFHRNDLSFSLLESRKLLAGDIQVLVNDGILLVVGDEQANQVQIGPSQAGGFEVSGVDTTINGATNSFVVDQGVNHVTIALNAGNDEAIVSGIAVADHFSFYGGDGDDRLTTTDSSSRYLHVKGENGNDVFNINFATRESAYVYLGAGDDVLSSNSLTTGRNLKVFGGEDSDTISFNSVDVGRKMEFRLAGGDDDVLMAGNTTVKKRTKIDLGSGNDFAAILPTNNSGTADFQRRIRITTGNGDNSVAFDSGVQADNAIDLRVGNGTNSFQPGGSFLRNQFNTNQFGTLPVEDLNTLVSEVLTRVDDANNVEPVQFSITPSSSLLTFNEDSNPIAIDDAFEVAGSDRVTNAEIRISDFFDGNETLNFVDTANISGSFSANGVLTLTGTDTTSAYQAAIRSVRYENTENDPTTSTRQFQFSVTTSSETLVASRDFEIAAVNDEPEIALGTSTRTVSPENLPVSLLNDNVTITDPDNANLVSASVSIVGGFVAGEDVLSVSENNGIDAAYNAANGILTINGDEDHTTWETILGTLSYDNSSNNPTSGIRTIQIAINDGSDVSTTEFNLTVGESAQPNQFTISQSAVNGTIVGEITTQEVLTSPIYQLANTDFAEALLINVDDHRSGESTAPVVLVEYFDFQCPACAAYHPIVSQLETEFAGDLMVVRRHLPLESVHPNARAAALASEAAAQQGAFEAMADLLFERQTSWNNVADPTPIFEDYANELGLNIIEFRADVANSDLDARVTRDRDEAAGLGATGTPTFFLEENQIATPEPSAFSGVIRTAVDAVDSPFAINLESGEITIYDRTLLNASSTPITLSIIVTGVDGNSETVDVTIDVTN